MRSRAMNARPHPGPLPQGEGEYFAIVGEFGRAQFAMRSEAKSQKAELARGTTEFSGGDDSYSLSPGERVRVRASVITNFVFPQFASTHPEAPAVERTPRVPVAASSERGSVSESVCVDARPHPGPLPQERENHSAVAGEPGRAQFALRLEAKPKETETTRETSELPESVDSRPLSPGERARVRASQITNFVFSQFTPTHPEAPAAERTPRVPVAASSERGSVSRSASAHRELPEFARLPRFQSAADHRPALRSGARASARFTILTPIVSKTNSTVTNIRALKRRERRAPVAIRLSLTPGFSPVWHARGHGKLFQQFSRPPKPLKRFLPPHRLCTGLQPGVNDRLNPNGIRALAANRTEAYPSS